MHDQSRLSNWGRWGSTDELGTLNLIAPRQIVEAARLIKSGKVYRLAVPMHRRHSSPFRDGIIHSVAVRHDSTPSGRSVAIDIMALDTHNFTHVDGLAHISCGGFLYNGVSASGITDQGTASHSIHNVKAVIGRAVLADVACERGASALKAGDVIGPEEIERTLAHRELEVRPGDILLIRTGWIKLYLQDPTIALQGWPGLGEATIKWLSDHDVCAVGADNVAVEVRPSEEPENTLVLHERFIRDLGGYLIEFLDLEELATDQVSEGFFVMSPLPIVGGLGSQVTPLLIT